jgi:hypothetical protein
MMVVFFAGAVGRLCGFVGSLSMLRWLMEQYGEIWVSSRPEPRLQRLYIDAQAERHATIRDDVCES